MTEIDDTAQIRAVKRELRSAIGDLAGVWRRLDDAVRREADAIREIDAQGRSPVPVVRFADIVGSTVPAGTVAEIHRRGAALIRGTVDRTRSPAGTTRSPSTSTTTATPARRTTATCRSISAG